MRGGWRLRMPMLFTCSGVLEEADVLDTAVGDGNAPSSLSSGSGDAHLLWRRAAVVSLAEEGYKPLVNLWYSAGARRWSLSEPGNFEPAGA